MKIIARKSLTLHPVVPVKNKSPAASNAKYELFVDMVAQYYDNIWLYTKAITEKYNADNRLDFGISKDLVFYTLKVDLY